MAVSFRQAASIAVVAAYILFPSASQARRQTPQPLPSTPGIADIFHKTAQAIVARNNPFPQKDLSVSTETLAKRLRNDHMACAFVEGHELVSIDPRPNARMQYLQAAFPFARQLPGFDAGAPPETAICQSDRNDDDKAASFWEEHKISLIYNVSDSGLRAANVYQTALLIYHERAHARRERAFPQAELIASFKSAEDRILNLVDNEAQAYAATLMAAFIAKQRGQPAFWNTMSDGQAKQQAFLQKLAGSYEAESLAHFLNADTLPPEMLRALYFEYARNLVVWSPYSKIIAGYFADTSLAHGLTLDDQFLAKIPHGNGENYLATIPGAVAYLEEIGALGSDWRSKSGYYYSRLLADIYSLGASAKSPVASLPLLAKVDLPNAAAAFSHPFASDDLNATTRFFTNTSSLFPLRRWNAPCTRWRQGAGVVPPPCH